MQPKPLPADYSVLTQRSIFEKGRRIFDTGSGASSRPPRNSSDAGSSSAPSGPIAPNVPADALIFNGATQTADGAYAFIEDIGSNTIALVQLGDAIAGGKVVSIAFDHLQLLVNGQTRDIQIGQTLTGRVGAAPPITSATPGSGAGGGGDASSGGSSETDAILERMRKKRAAESGGK